MNIPKDIVFSCICDFVLFFLFFHFYFPDRECIALVKKTDLEILMDLHVLGVTESKKVIFGMSVCVCVCLSACLSVCPSVCVHYNSKID